MARTQDTSLFDMPVEEIKFEHLEQFFVSGFPEGEKIEYRDASPDTGRPDSTRVASTIGAMSNTEGGIIFLGVVENERDKTPRRWPGVSIGDPRGWVGNVCHSHVTPMVFPQVRACRNKDTGDDVVLIRVPVGQNQPYFEKDKGVLVRIGDQNRPADLITLERMFRRKIEPLAQIERLEHLLQERRLAMGPAAEPSQLVLIIGPKYAEVPIRMSRELDKMLRGTLQQISMEFPSGRVSSSLEPQFGSKRSTVSAGSRTEGENDRLSLDHKGTMDYTSYLPKEFNEERKGWDLKVQPWQLAKEIYRILDLAERVYAATANYREPVFVGIALSNIQGVALLDVAPMLRIGAQLAREWKETFELSYDHDKAEVIRDILEGLLRELQYEGAERIADHVLEQMEKSLEARN